MENEKIMAYDVAYFLYEDGARVFPEAKDMFAEIEKDMLEKSKEKKREELLDPLLTMLKLYRIAGLIEKGIPIISKESISLWKKIIYDYEPSKTFVDFALLILFLMKSYKASVKTYDKEEVETLADILIRELIPGKDYQSKVYFLSHLAEFTKNKEISDRLAINLEKWGDSISKEKDCQDLLVVRKYFCSFEVYSKLLDYFNSARVLHMIIKFCQEQKNNYIRSLIQIEALRLLAASYHRWCYEQKKKDEEHNEVDSQKYIQQALQATASYIDCARFDLEHKKCPWLSLHNLQKAYSFSEEFYVENDLVVELLQKARNEWENLEENEDYEKSALIIANESDAGAASVIAEAVIKEKVFPQVDVTNVRDTEVILGKMAEHNISFLLMHPDSNFSFYKEDDVLPIIASYHKEQNTGWFIREYGEHIQFIIWEKTPAELFTTCLKFLEENIFRSYV